MVGALETPSAKGFQGARHLKIKPECTYTCIFDILLILQVPLFELFYRETKGLPSSLGFLGFGDKPFFSRLLMSESGASPLGRGFG